MQVAGDGYSLLDRAVMEHNLISTARVYSNISLTELGAVLALDADRAEKVAAAMITEGRLRGIIDQTGERMSVADLTLVTNPNFSTHPTIEGYLLFEEGGSTLASWDQAIEEVCSDVSTPLPRMISTTPSHCCLLLCSLCTGTGCGVCGYRVARPSAHDVRLHRDCRCFVVGSFV
jgi:hypothetical protein